MAVRAETLWVGPVGPKEHEMEQPRTDPGMTTDVAPQKRELLDEAVQRITNLAIEVSSHARGLEMVLTGGGVTEPGAATPEPEGYADMTLNRYAQIESLLVAAEDVLTRLDGQFRERPHDVGR